MRFRQSMTKDRQPDPVDLMLDGKFEEAAKAYLELYVDALKRGDFAFGPDLLMGMQYCVAGITKHEPTAREVEIAVKRRLAEHNVKFDKHVEDDLQIANSMVK